MLSKICCKLLLHGRSSAFSLGAPGCKRKDWHFARTGGQGEKEEPGQKRPPPPKLYGLGYDCQSQKVKHDYSLPVAPPPLSAPSLLFITVTL